MPRQRLFHLKPLLLHLPTNWQSTTNQHLIIPAAGFGSDEYLFSISMHMQSVFWWLLASLCWIIYGSVAEFGRDIATFGLYKIPPPFYSLAFSGILSFVPLLFARISANTAKTEAQVNPKLAKSKQIIKQLRANM